MIITTGDSGVGKSSILEVSGFYTFTITGCFINKVKTIWKYEVDQPVFLNADYKFFLKHPVVGLPVRICQALINNVCT